MMTQSTASTAASTMVGSQVSTSVGPSNPPAAAKQAAARPGVKMPAVHQNWHIPSRYEVRHNIGAGSYGQVSEVYDRQERRVVAIKRVHRVFEDLIDCKRILREIALLNRLNHPNVVRILDICVPQNLEDFDELYIVLEIADSDLKKLFRTEVYLSELHIKTLLYNLLVGLKYVGSAGIYHRDLKPANCLINQDCTVKICDFGLARTVDKPAAAIPLPSSPRNLMVSQNQPPEIVVPHTRNMKKQLTSHVVTRWYRAPELILLQENYTEAIDMWSTGCIFAEMLNMIKENCPRNVGDRGPLFPGQSCFPLSPDQKHATDYKFHTRGNRDQLNVIFNILGTPKPSEIESLEKEEARRYVKYFTPREAVDLAKRFPGSSPAAVDLLKRMLVFEPKKRITVNEALAHPFLKELRNPAQETVAPAKITLPFDDWQNMDENQLRYSFLKEIEKFHPELKIPARLEKIGYGVRN